MAISVTTLMSMLALFGTLMSDTPVTRQYDWEGAKVYVFGPYILDLNRSIEQWIPGRSATVSNCSSDDFYCVRSSGGIIGIANFVIPKKCLSISIGNKWTKDGMTTVVIGHTEKSKTSSRAYYLATDIQDDVVFKYNPSIGIIQIHRGHNIVRKYLERNSMPSDYSMVFGYIRSSDKLAPCAENN